MRISFKFDWKKRVFDKTKMYSLRTRDKILINKIFDELQNLNKLFWINQSTFFNYSIFCVWKIINEKRKKRVVIDIREFNVITQSNVYFLSLQMNIITTIRNCLYIIIVNVFAFFYQWRVYFNDRHKLIVVNYREQKLFNVAIIKYKNSSIYVQKQIDRFFRVYRKFVKIYIDDIIIFSRIFEKHVTHLRQIFKKFVQFNIFIKLIKTFIDYSFVQLLDQKINFLICLLARKNWKQFRNFNFFAFFDNWKRT